ncbi:MAG: DUF3343 domain-containing protein, partial [Spirochaetaceae bacterium]|nr:DUF3343 domain-containing protein [Spirochaetaceae bacterium]
MNGTKRLPAPASAAAPSVESIICFESTSQAIMAEQALIEKAFSVRVMPKPAAIEAGCGFCLRFSPDDLDRAVLFLASCGIDVKETYRMEESDGITAYSKL